MMPVNLEFFVDIPGDFLIFENKTKNSRNVDGPIFLKFMPSILRRKSLPNNLGIQGDLVLLPSRYVGNM
jgi:hypothetical protein